MCPWHNTQRGPLREDSQGGRDKLRGRWGAKSTHTTTLSKAGPGPLTLAEAPLLLSSKNHPLLHVLQLCCKWAVFLPGKTSRRRKYNLLGSNIVLWPGTCLLRSSTYCVPLEKSLDLLACRGPHVRHSLLQTSSASWLKSVLETQ